MEHLDGRVVTFDDDHIRERSRMIPIGIDASPTVSMKRLTIRTIGGRVRRTAGTRQNVVKNYNLRDMYI